MGVNNELEMKSKEMVVDQLEILYQNCVEKQRKSQRTSVTTVSIFTEIRIGELLAIFKKRYSLIELHTVDPFDPNEVNFTHVCSYALGNEVHKLFAVIRVEIFSKQYV